MITFSFVLGHVRISARRVPIGSATHSPELSVALMPQIIETAAPKGTPDCLMLNTRFVRFVCIVVSRADAAGLVIA